MTLNTLSIKGIKHKHIDLSGIIGQEFALGIYRNIMSHQGHKCAKCKKYYGECDSGEFFFIYRDLKTEKNDLTLSEIKLACGICCKSFGKSIVKKIKWRKNVADKKTI